MGIPRSFQHLDPIHGKLGKRARCEAKKNKQFRVKEIKNKKRNRERKRREELNDTNRN